MKTWHSNKEKCASSGNEFAVYLSQYCWDSEPDQEGLRKKWQDALANGESFEGVNLKGCNLDGLDLRNINLAGSNLEGASFRETNLGGANLYQVRANEAIFVRAYLSNCNAELANFGGAIIDQADFSSSNLARCSFVGVKGRDVNFENSELFFARPAATDLSGSSFKGCKIERTIFRAAILTGCNFEKCTGTANFDRAVR